MLSRPPDQLVYSVDRLAPGIYGAFFGALGEAHSGIRVTPTNYYRNKQQNERVGGAQGSQHQLGLAFDLVYPSYAERMEAITRMRRTGLVVIDEGDHVHVQAWPAPIALRALRSLGILR